MTLRTERRQHPRCETRGLTATIGQAFRWNRITADVLDYNRYGMSLRLTRPLATDQTIDIELDFGTMHIAGVVGVIHNCRGLRDGGYRCGIQFRTGARTQLDRNQIRAQLARLEREIGAEVTGADVG